MLFIFYAVPEIQATASPTNDFVGIQGEHVAVNTTLQLRNLYKFVSNEKAFLMEKKY
jgi:hypothetical protein